jgi:hypothetical protein
MQFPLSFWDIGLLLGATAIILLITAELTSPYHGQTNLLINNERLENTALVTWILLMATIAIRIYGIIASS